MKKESNPYPPKDAVKPPPPPAPPKKKTAEMRLSRKFSRKVRSAYVKQAKKDMKEIFDKACEWPFRKRLRLALTILRGKRKIEK